MTRDQNPTNFEEQLLARLRATVDARATTAATPEASTASTAWRRAPRLAFAGAAITAVAVGALVVSAGGDDTTAAYAVTPHGNGKVSVEIRDLSDPKGLERALDVVGVPAAVNYGAAGEACDPSNLQSADAETSDAGEPVMSTVTVGGESPARFTVSRKQIQGKTLVVTAAPGPDGKSAVQATVAEGTVSPSGGLAPCESGQPTTSTVPAEVAHGADAESAQATKSAEATP